MRGSTRWGIAIGGAAAGLGLMVLLAPDTGTSLDAEPARRAKARARDGATAAAEARAEPRAEVAPVAELPAPERRPDFDPKWLALRARPDARGDAVWTPMVVPPPPAPQGEPERRRDGQLPADVVGIETLVAERDEDVRTCAGRHLPESRGERRVVMAFTLEPVEGGTRIAAIRGAHDTEARYDAFGGCLRASLDAVRLQPQPEPKEDVVTWPLRL